MRLKARDLVGTVLVVAIAVPYVWYLIEGSAPFIEDPRGMSAIGLLLALGAYMVMQRNDPDDTTDRVEIALYVVSLGLGVLAVTLAETASAEVLLAVFMGSILVVWAIKMMDHAGVLPMAQHPTGSI
ncbi:MAG: hypothetical protein ACLGH4_09645, partial [Actinomycetes bacterium]